MTTRTCRRCSGTGYLPAFAHVANGRCARCAGAGTVGAPLTVAAAPVEDSPTLADQRAARARIAARRAR